MSANIDTMMYTGEVPWHGQGIRLENPPTAAEAMGAAGLDWQVITVPLYREQPALDILTYAEVPAVATVRKDTNQVLGVVKPTYVPVQNRDAFAFFDHMVGEGYAEYHTAGSLGIGERVWVLCKLPDTLELKLNGKRDQIDPYLLFVTSHDGTLAIRTMFTPVRVVCQNTVDMAIAGGEKTGNVIRTQHIGNVLKRLRDTAALMEETIRMYTETQAVWQTMVSTRMDEQGLTEYIEALIPPAKKVQAQVNQRRQALYDIHDGHPTTEGIRGTVWGAYNSASFYADHIMPEGHKDRLRSVWFGRAAQFRQEAFSLAVAALN